MGSNDLALHSLIEGFRLSCQAEGKSPRTVDWYTTFLTKFNRFLQSTGGPTDLRQITRDCIRAFILYLQTEAKTPYKGKPLSPFTVWIGSIQM
ncbi:phage integrase N-terminal SAM-like domain-containing protein [Chloroflexota bacterium]